jgi:hypothetical protein
LDAPAFGQFVARCFDSRFGFVRLVGCQNEMRLGVMPGCGSYPSQELRPTVKIRFGRVCCNRQHSRAGKMSRQVS